MLDKLLQAIGLKAPDASTQGQGTARPPAVSAPAPLMQSPASTNAHSANGVALAQQPQVIQMQCPPELTAKANLLDRVTDFLRSKIDFLPKAIIESLASLGLDLAPKQTAAPSPTTAQNANDINNILAALSQPINAGAGIPAPGQVPQASQDDEIAQLMQMLSGGGANQQTVQAPPAPAGTTTQADAGMGDLSKMLEQLEKQLGAIEQQAGTVAPAANQKSIPAQAPAKSLVA